MSMAICTLAIGQKATDNLTMEFDVSRYDHIRIHNYNGNVKVTTKPGSKLSLKVKRTIEADSQARLNALQVLPDCQATIFYVSLI